MNARDVMAPANTVNLGFFIDLITITIEYFSV